MNIFKNIILPNVLLIAAFLVLVLKIGSPFHVYIAMVLFTISLVRLTISIKRHRVYSEYKPKFKEKLRPYRLHIAVLAVILVMIYIGRVLIPVEDSFLTELSAEQIQAELSRDYKTFMTLQQQCDGFFDDMQTGNWAVIDRPLRDDEIEQLRRQRRLFSDIFLEYSFFREKYRGYYLVDYVAKRQMHSDAFFLAFGAFIGQYEASLKVVRIVGDNKVVETVLDEDDAQAGFPKNSYYYIKQQLTSPRALLQLNAGRAYLALVKKDITFGAAAVERLEKRISMIDELFGREMDIFVKNPLELLERASSENWLPAQKQIAVMMGRVHPSSRPYYITPDVIAKYAGKLEPGDIVITRRKWHLSNVGIPGFWTHSLLYTGTPRQFDDFFAEFAPRDKGNMFDLIAGMYPDARLSGTDGDGRPLCCVEAVEEGVVQHPLEVGLNADYIAVLRPKTAKQDKFKAVTAAMSFVGRPYDYNFDFATDNSLVCSEVVYKAYSSSLPIEPQKQNGRLLLSPNSIARYFDTMADTPDCGLEFVLFLDIKDGKVVEATPDDFRKSWTRPKWDIMLE